MACKDKEKRRAYQREYLPGYRKLLKQAHLCLNCHQQDDFTLGGAIYCEACREKRLAKNKTYNANNRETIAEKAKAKRDARRAAGLCTTCGKPAWSGHVTCIDCSIRDRNRQLEKRRKAGIVSKDHFREVGLCVTCGQPRADRVRAWDGSPVMLCERCYQNSLKASEAMRASYLEKHGETWGQTEYNRYQKKNASSSSAKFSRLSPP